MRAIVREGKGDVNVLHFVNDEPKPQVAAPDELLLRIHYCAVNPSMVYFAFHNLFAVDYKLRTGEIPFGALRILGYDGSAVVEEAGDAAASAGYEPGTRVMFFKQSKCGNGTGAYAEYIVVKMSEVALVPEGFRMDAAAAVPLVGCTVWQMFGKSNLTERGQLRGESILIVGGSGGTGSWAIMLARHFFEAERVYAVASARNADYMRSLGAHVTIDYKTEDFVEVIRDGRKAEKKAFPHLRVCLDCVGGKERSNRCCSLLTSRDFYVTIGISPGEAPSLFMFHMPWKKLKRAFRRGPSWNIIMASAVGDNIARVLEGVGPERVQDLIPITIFQFAQMKDAHTAMESHWTVGKIVVQVFREEGEEDRFANLWGSRALEEAKARGEFVPVGIGAKPGEAIPTDEEEEEEGEVHVTVEDDHGASAQKEEETIVMQKAILMDEFGDRRVLKYGEIAVADPGEGEIQIQIRATSINPVEWKIRCGYLKSYPHAFPIVLGWDVAGVVSKVGYGVSQFAVGDEVFAYGRRQKLGTAFGSYCQFVCLPWSFVVKKPPSLSFEQAACLPLVGLTAYQCVLEKAELSEGQSILIVGASGGVGSNAIELARIVGASRIIAVSSRSNFDYMKKLGATHCIDYNDDIVDQVREVVGDDGLDVILDCRGHGTLMQLHSLTKKNGWNVTILEWGYEAPRDDIKSAAVLVEPNAIQLKQISDWVEEGKMESKMTHVWEWDQIVEAHRKSETGHAQGKAALKILPLVKEAEVPMQKAIVMKKFGGREVLDYAKVPILEPGEGEVQINILATSINPVEWKIRAGHLKTYPHTFPIVLGWDIAGIVTKGVSQFQVGDEVYAYGRRQRVGPSAGSYCQSICLPWSFVAKKPPTLSFEAAACLPLTGLTTYQSIIEKGNLSAGQSILIIGASGGVGGNGIEMARIMGATKIIAVSSRDNFDYMRRLGATHCADYSDEDVVEQVKSFAGEEGVDIIFDCYGSGSLMKFHSVTKTNGFNVSIAEWGYKPPRDDIRADAVFVVPNATQLNQMSEWVMSGLLTSKLNGVWQWNDIVKAHAQCEGGHARGKMAMKIAPLEVETPEPEESEGEDEKPMHKAILMKEFGDRDVLLYEDLPIPEPGEGEVQINIRATSINPVEWKIRAGHFKTYPHEFPIVLGWDVAGVVTKGVSQFNVGDEVYAYGRRQSVGPNSGAYCQFCCLPWSFVCLKPASMSFEAAACLPLTGLTAYQSIFEKANLSEGQSILVVGASGGVGSNAIEMAAAVGATTIIAVASARNFEYMGRLGATHCIDYRTEDILDQIRAIVGEEGVDVIFDCFGSGTLVKFQSLTKMNGENVSIAEWGYKPSRDDIHFSSVFVEPNATQLAHMSQWVGEGKLSSKLSGIWEWDQVKEAHEMSEGGHSRGKFALRIARL